MTTPEIIRQRRAALVVLNNCGLTVAQIAEILGVNLSTVRNDLPRIRGAGTQLTTNKTMDWQRAFQTWIVWREQIPMGVLEELTFIEEDVAALLARELGLSELQSIAYGMEVATNHTSRPDRAANHGQDDTPLVSLLRGVFGDSVLRKDSGISMLEDLLCEQRRTCTVTSKQELIQLLGSRIGRDARMGIVFDHSELAMELVQDVLTEFPERDQEAIRLRHWEGMKLDQVGRQLGVTQERARQILGRVHRVLKNTERYRRLLEPLWNGVNLSDPRRAGALVTLQGLAQAAAGLCGQHPMIALVERDAGSSEDRLPTAELEAGSFDHLLARLATSGGGVRVVWRRDLEDSDTGELEPLIAVLCTPIMDAVSRWVPSGISVRTENCLSNANLTHLLDVLTKNEADLLKTKNFGRKSLNELKEVLAEMSDNAGVGVLKLAMLERDSATATTARGRISALTPSAE